MSDSSASAYHTKVYSPNYNDEKNYWPTDQQKQDEWHAEFKRYKTYPEWQQRRSMTLEEFKHIFFWEVGSRPVWFGPVRPVAVVAAAAAAVARIATATHVLLR